MKKLMLIVDDNEINQGLLTSIFEDDFKIKAVSSGREALSMMSFYGKQISVILLDLVMPDMDGFEVLDRMGENPKLLSIPVIVVSARSSDTDGLEAIRKGAADFVTKPVNPELIRIRVAAAVSRADNARLRAENEYISLQSIKEAKYRTVLESSGTVVVEYNRVQGTYQYDPSISSYIAGDYDNRKLWQILMSDMVADIMDVKAMQELVFSVSNKNKKSGAGMNVKLKTPTGDKQWFRMQVFMRPDQNLRAETILLTFNNINDEAESREKLRYQAERDALTGLYNRAAFFSKAADMIAAQRPGYYVMACFDIDNFKVINDQYGTEKGDEVLKFVANAFSNGFHAEGGLVGRIMADNFSVLYPAGLIGSRLLMDMRNAASVLDGSIHPISFSIGRYLINDLSMSVSAMYDRAALAEQSVKGRYDQHIAWYDESMRDQLIRRQEIVYEMKSALETGQFEVWLQPQVNHATKALIGAEALVRWRHPDKGIVPPGEFIPVFERNGFVYELDKYVWERTCALLRGWMDEGRDPLPLSVNISRHDLFHDELTDVITGLVSKYGIPINMLRLEITESAFAESTEHVVSVVKRLIDHGFTVEIDDFGNGYSSLNTLKDVPAQVLKLDMRFLQNSEDADRSGNVIESVVRMAKWLGMAVIAEGVETIEQADYLKTIGCTYVQGYLYARPMPVSDYEKLVTSSGKEEKMLALETVKNLDNNAFWDSKSMDTLIFNSFVGAAFIMEYTGSRIELLRVSDMFIQTLGSEGMTADVALKLDWASYCADESYAALTNAIKQSIKTGSNVTGEYVFHDLPGCPSMTYLRITLRVIASTSSSHMVYCLSENTTAQRELEEKERASAEQLQAIMANINGGVNVSIIKDGVPQVQFANEQYYAMRGYTREQFEAEVKHLDKIIYPDDRELMYGATSKADKPFSIIYRIMRRDGEVRWVLNNVTFVRLPGFGEPVQLSVTNDITEMREVEEKERASAEQLNIIMENINGGVAAATIKDGEPCILFANKQYYAQLGYTKEQYEAEPNRNLIVHDDDRERMLNAVNNNTEPFSVVYRIVRRDGEVRWLQNNITTIRLPEVQGPVQLSVSNDITDLREAERKEHEVSNRLQGVLEALNSGVSGVTMTDGRLSYVFANEMYYTMLGYTREQFESEIMNGLDVVHPDDRERITGEVERLYAEGGNATLEYRVIRRDGETAHLRVNVSLLPLVDGESPVFLGVITDITDIINARQSVFELSERVQFVMDSVGSGITANKMDDGKVKSVFSNDTFYELHGYTRQQYQAEVQDVFTLLHPDDRQRVYDIVKQINKEGANLTLEYRIIRRDGQERWLKAIISTRSFTGETQPVLFTVYTDITDEKQRRELLRETNEQLKFLNDTASELLAQPDVVSGISKVLQLMLECFGADRAFIFENDIGEGVCHLTYEACRDGVAPSRKKNKRVPIDTAWYWREAFERERFLHISDVNALGDDRAGEAKLLRGFGARSVIAVSLNNGGVNIGTLGVINPTLHLSDYENLRALADYMTIVLVRRDLYARIENDRVMLQTMMQDMPGGFARLRVLPDGSVATEYINDTICIMRGMTRDEILSADKHNAMDTVHPDDLELVRRTINEMVTTGEARNIRYRLKHANGSYNPYSAFCRVTTDDDGAKHINAYYVDLSEQEKKEQTIRDTVPFVLSAILTFSGDLAFAKDRELRYICASNAFLAFADLPNTGDVIGKTDYDIFPKEMADQFRRDDERLLKADAPLVNYIEAIPDAEGNIRYYTMSKYILRDTVGNVLGLYGTGRDITEERDAYARLKLLVSSIPGGIATYVSSPDGFRITYFNDGFCSLMGYTHEEYERITAEGVTTLIHPEDVSGVMESVQALIYSEEPLDCTFRVRCKDGSIKWVNLRGSVAERHGVVSLMYAVLYDVTARMEAEQELRVSEEEFRIAAALGGRSVAKYDIKTGVYRHRSPYLFSRGFGSTVDNVPQAFIDAGVITPECVGEYLAFYDKLRRGEDSCSVDVGVVANNGELRWLRENATIMTDEDGSPLRAIIVFSDITELREKEAIFTKWQQSLRQRPPETYMLFRCNLSRNSVYDTSEGRLLWIEFSKDEATFSAHADEYARRCVCDEDRAKYLAFLDIDSLLGDYSGGKHVKSIEYREAMPDGALRWLRLTVEMVEYSGSSDVEAFLLFEDIDAAKRDELHTRELAETDPLTGLLNRMAFSQAVERIIAEQHPNGRHAVMMLDIDAFKQINDTFGHAMGDKVLQDTANELRGILRHGDLVSRLGGDEFLIFLKDVYEDGAIRRKAEQVCAMLNKSLSDDVQTSTSIGIAVCPRDGGDFETLYRKADTALYRVKAHGKNSYAFYSDEA